jgi:hypothetical protein
MTWREIPARPYGEALHAISTLSNSSIDGRAITVREDREDRDLK